VSLECASALRQNVGWTGSWAAVAAQKERFLMYIGLGTLVIVLVVVAIIYFVRRA
jgi:heme/copper-type cytochrome/quinol oxidase subunit 2